MKIFHFWSQVAWTYQQIKSVLRLHGPIWTAILCSGCMDLYDCHFVLRSHGYMICILHSGHMDLFCMCELTAQRLHTYTIQTLDSELLLPFCAQATQTYMITILHSGFTDLYDHCFVLRSHGPIICHPNAALSHLITVQTLPKVNVYCLRDGTLHLLSIYYEYLTITNII